jgi:hypothetical protein
MSKRPTYHSHHTSAQEAAEKRVRKERHYPSIQNANRQRAEMGLKKTTKKKLGW